MPWVLSNQGPIELWSEMTYRAQKELLMENALPATLLFLKSKDCQLSCICWLQLSWCHLERKVNPWWLNTRTSNVSTAHIVDTETWGWCTVGGESKNSRLIVVHSKSSALKSTRSRKRIRISFLGAELSKSVTRPECYSFLYSFLNVFSNVKSPIKMSRSPVLHW